MRSSATPQLAVRLTPSTSRPPKAFAPRAYASHRPAVAPQQPVPARPVSAGQGLLAMPFDTLRFQYASAVMAGLVPRSLLASGRLERTLDALEKLVLGPLARQR